MSVSAESHGDQIREMYESGKSSYEIAEELGTYQIKIHRILKKLGVKTRSKSESTKESLASGRLKHPTLGTHVSEEIKEKIAVGISKNWSKKTDEERLAIAEEKRKAWEDRTEEQKRTFRENAFIGIRNAAIDGSKFENAIYDAIVKMGVQVVKHAKIFHNEKLEADLVLPEIQVIIEVDGPSHALPIWGEEKLLKVQKADTEKNALVLAKNFRIIRVQCFSKNVKKIEQDRLIGLTIEKIKEFQDRNDQPIEERLVYIK